ncbi:MAG: hypothetical protein OSJ70_00165 [Bacilli bacterium]|nr:hypothetical protein [Bacilli bacterium]
MEKMIKVINDNLRSVINGIKVHKADTEKTLAAIKAEMDSKILIANEYKLNVENSRMIISNLENEISGLEKDLSDLNAKFGTKDFREILAAGNKEINTKIIEKRAQISEQSQRIAELTEKARLLKTNLIKLKEKKISTETTLSKDVVLEQYYETRINEIIEYSEENPQGIRDFVEDIPQTELLTSFEDIDTSDIRSTIDGSVFEEIDNISSDSVEIDENLIKKVIVNGPSLESDDDSESDAGIDLTMTQQLDDIILQANDLLAKSKEINKSAAAIRPFEMPTPAEPKVVPTPAPVAKQEEVVVPSKPIAEEPKEEPIIPEIPEKKENINIFVPDDLEEITIPSKNIVTPTASTPMTSHDELLGSKDEESIFNVLDELNGDDILSSISNLNTDDDDDDDVLELKIENDELDSIVKNTDELSDELTKELDSNIVTAQSFAVSDKDITEELKECNLEANRFSDSDLEMIKKNFNKNNTMDFINVMRKHNIAVARIYESANVLASVTPQNLDHILSILEDTGAISNSISYVFNLLDRVNINALEELVNERKDYELTDLLYKVIPYNGEKNLADLIDLTPMEEGVLRKNTSSDEFKMMNLFASIVAANYNELKKYDIRNINECITKYPHRFTLNPDNFSAILDKYDPEDLVRCINKNCAVINKL